VPKLPSNLYAGLTSSKWKERKEVLDDLLTLLNAAPRIKEAPEFGELSKALALRVQGDANINCVMVAAQCLEGLAKGLMGNYGRYREIVVPPMLDRLKERKASVTDTLSAALHAIFETVRKTSIHRGPLF
jgi:cytoskeleton-associated protein 5